MSTVNSTAVAPTAARHSAFPLLRLSEASELLGVHPNTLREWSNKGEFETIVLPSGHRRYTREAINTFLGFDEGGDSNS